MYRLNVCLLSGIFEKSFGLSGFFKDYEALLNTLSPKTLEEYLEYKDWRQDYRLFCKLAHFFDDFNFFINIQLSPKNTQERYSKFSSVDEGFQASFGALRA